ncbi:DGQHR domain-containing protein [Nostoc sp. JL23]|uniref:DGQHR domain-containing protein n=1 Tax=Nostoc sp. JL23 TaxID=2815394 RepID=UPI001D2AE841|nr:DGQHR domain-containing protein [Nostoc sp. JL23]MBN3875658.1 DGQHR domain-containing protein [Nostoc sp. JL23]
MTEHRCYFGSLVSQRRDEKATRFFVFNAQAKDLKSWLGIRRIKDVQKGAQRILRQARVNAVKKFIGASSINIIPNSILIAFDPNKAIFTPLGQKINEYIIQANSSLEKNIDILNGCRENQVTWGIIEFSFEQSEQEYLKPALIVDGQHRLYGMSDFNEEDLPITVVSLIDATPQEQAFQFIVVNNKAVRVSTENVKSIVADFNEDELEKRLVLARVKYGDKPLILKFLSDSPTSPFQNLLEWSYNRESTEETQLVPITAIEQAMRYIRKCFTVLENDEDSLIEFFCATWRAVKGNYPELFGKNNQFMRKANINAFNEYITDRLLYFWEMDLLDIFDSDEIAEKVLDIIKRLPKEFWLEDWKLRIQDTPNFREILKNDFKIIITNCKLGKQWSDGLELVQTEE